MNKYKTVDEFLRDQSETKKAQIELLRQIIISTEPNVQEGIKWNAPNYVSGGQDRITFNVMNKEGLVKLVFHMGALRKENKKGEPVIADDAAELLEWVSDIRGYATFKNIEEIRKRKSDLKNFITRWLAIK